MAVRSHLRDELQDMRKEIREDFAALNARLTSLELAAAEARGRGRGWVETAKSVGSAIAFIISVIALFSCAGCAPGDADFPTGLHEAWGGEMTVAISPLMSPRCREVTLMAISDWQSIGVSYMHTHVMDDPEWIGFLGFCPDGYVCVVQGHPTTPRAAAETLWYHDGGWTRNAEITLQTCTVPVVRHELGHALGLEDLYEEKYRGNVMFWSETYVGADLLPWQAKWVLQ